ncbi:MAG TPA: glycosyltransferase [Chthonomonadales bacterium]|nr:glycosyltransferase [Chthonomonadales bacterium]
MDDRADRYRVALVLSAFPKLSETFIVSKFLGLLERGWDVHVVCASSDLREWDRFPALAARPELRGRVHLTLPVHPRPIVPILWPAALLRCLLRSPAGTLRYLLRGWRRFGPGVVRHFYVDAPLVALRPSIVHIEFGALAVGREHLREMLDCRLVVSFRGYDANFAGLEQPGYYDAVWQAADALHLLGRDLWRRAVSRGCPPDKPHALIPPAIDAERFQRPGRPADESEGLDERPLRVLSVGRLEWKKGYEFALLAIARLRSEGVPVRYSVVGDGAYLEAVAFARRQLGLTDCVELHFAQPPEVVRKMLAEADVFLHAAVSEGFCNAVLEAQAMRLPVVCTDAGGLPENVVDGETGFVAPRRDPVSLADKLALLARDPALRRRMGEAGRRRVLEHFRVEDQITAFDRLYRSVLDGRDGVARCA